MLPVYARNMRRITLRMTRARRFGLRNTTACVGASTALPNAPQMPNTANSATCPTERAARSEHAGAERASGQHAPRPQRLFIPDFGVLRQDHCHFDSPCCGYLRTQMHSC